MSEQAIRQIADEMKRDGRKRGDSEAGLALDYYADRLLAALAETPAQEQEQEKEQDTRVDDSQYGERSGTAAGNEADPPPLFRIDVEREDDGRFLAHFETGDKSIAGSGNYADTVSGALHALIQTLIWIEEDDPSTFAGLPVAGRGTAAGEQATSPAPETKTSSSDLLLALQGLRDQLGRLLKGTPNRVSLAGFLRRLRPHVDNVDWQLALDEFIREAESCADDLDARLAQEGT